MEYLIRKARDRDVNAVVDIMNHYVRNTLYAYPEREVGPEFFTWLKQIVMGFSFYVVDFKGKVVGFGLMRPYHPCASFSRTGELTYFILPEHTRKGLGTRLINILLEDAKDAGKDNVVVNISSKNDASLRFHEKLGFVECGRFKRVGRKFGEDFDVIYMQKFLEG